MSGVKELCEKLCKEHDERAKVLRIVHKPDPLPQPPAPAGDVIRLVQWNILAHSLSDDGFLVKHILPPYDGCLSYEDLVEKVVKAHDSKDTDALNSIAEANKSEEAAANHAAVVDWQRRWARIRAMIASFQPHIITLEELDHMEDAQLKLGDMGYECGFPEKRYQRSCDKMVGKASPKEYMESLKESGVAFMPKRPSTGRKLANQAGRDDADDDGNAIFWLKSAFKLVDLSWVPVQGGKKYEGAVRVDLKRIADGQVLTVFCAHISSGSKPEDDVDRDRDICGKTLDPEKEDASQPSLRERFEARAKEVPTIFCMDANAAPDRRPDKDTLTTPWKAFRELPDTTSVWDKYFSPDGSAKAGDMPWTTNKMRGPLSGQPKKVGEHAIGVIDHIFLGKGVKLVGHPWGPLTCKSEADARQDMLPTLSMPSDHAPVVVDVKVAPAPAPVDDTVNQGVNQVRNDRCSYCGVL